MKPSIGLGYKVISCTSEDPTHPASSMMTASIRSPGWLTAPNPKYPVELLLDMTTIVELDNLQFVSNQYKIANKVDLYVAGEDRRFQALGSLQFSDNTQTNFYTRELKSVSLSGIKARYLKLLIQGCHVNPNNSANQVGFTSLQLNGRGGIQRSYLSPPRGGSDSDTAELLSSLERQKAQAVSNEDFKEAESLKHQIDRIKQVYDQIIQLQHQKVEAVRKEDYINAQRLKTEIDSLLNGPKSNNFKAQNTFDDDIPIQRPPPKRKPRQETFVEAPISPPDPEPVIERKKERKIEKKPEPIPKPEKKAPKSRAPDPVDPSPDPDSRPIHPAHKEEDSLPSPKRAPRAKMSNNDKDLPTDPDELSEANRQEAGVLVDLFGEKPLALFFSKSWNLKVEGMKSLTQLIVGLKDQQAIAYGRYCTLVHKERMNETLKAVFQCALESVMTVGDKLQLPQNELERSLAPLMPGLQTKIGCTQTALSDLACHFVVWMGSKGLYNLALPLVLHEIGNQNLWKVALAQVRTLHELILKHEAIPQAPGITTKSIMHFVIPCMESPKAEVRSATAELIATMKLFLGSAINAYFDKLPKRTREALEGKIMDIEKEQE